MIVRLQQHSHRRLQLMALLWLVCIRAEWPSSKPARRHRYRQVSRQAMDLAPQTRQSMRHHLGHVDLIGHHLVHRQVLHRRLQHLRVLLVMTDSVKASDNVRTSTPLWRLQTASPCKALKARSSAAQLGIPVPLAHHPQFLGLPPHLHQCQVKRWTLRLAETRLRVQMAIRTDLTLAPICFSVLMIVMLADQEGMTMIAVDRLVDIAAAVIPAASAGPRTVGRL